MLVKMMIFADESQLLWSTMMIHDLDKPSSYDPWHDADDLS